MEGVYFISFYENNEIPNLIMKDVKKMIQAITGIDEKNQRFSLSFRFGNYSFEKFLFWNKANLEIYNINNYRKKLTRRIYETNITLDLNKEKRFKKSVREQTKVILERLQFLLNKKILDDNKILKDDNLFEKKLSVNITKEINIQ